MLVGKTHTVNSPIVGPIRDFIFKIFIILNFCSIRCCEKTMEVMRSSQEALLTIVEVKHTDMQTQYNNNDLLSPSSLLMC